MQVIFDKAVALHDQGQVAQAIPIYQQLLSAQPEHPIVNARMAMAMAQQGQLAQALVCYDVAIKSLPAELRLLQQASGVAVQAADYERAERWLRLMLALDASHQVANEQLAGVLVGQHREEEALDYVKAAIKGNPQSANAYNLKGLVESRLGQTDKGYKSFKKALQLNPGQLGVVRNLILYGKGKPEPLLEQLMPQLEQKYQSPLQSNAAKMNLAYILFMYFEKKAPEKAFRYLQQGNLINRKSYQYSHDQTLVTFKKLMGLFSEPLKHAFEGKGLEEEAPIFIVGMPRSGTTLIEQILSSHSLVEAEGEIEDLRKAFESGSSALLSGSASLDKQVQACQAIATGYLGKVRSRQSARYFTDKMPYNFMLLGLIATAMPHARIIHCTRDPLETCYSIYKQNFSGSHAYTNDLKELGQYYNAYRKMMAYWEALFPESIYEANYERMVKNPDEEIRSLLAFCKLEEEPQCLAFYKNKRAVRTASVAQVRQPIYTDSLKASKPFEEELRVLTETLASGDGGEL